MQERQRQPAGGGAAAGAAARGAGAGCDRRIACLGPTHRLILPSVLTSALLSGYPRTATQLLSLNLNLDVHIDSSSYKYSFKQLVPAKL